MSNHNKKRNVGLLYEFLIQTITEALIDNNKKKIWGGSEVNQETFQAWYRIT